MASLTLYTHPQSRGRTARFMLEEVGQPYEAVVLDYGTTMKAPDYLAINPMGKVPALVHGEQRVTECAAICAYLADAFPDAELAPPPGERGAYYRWLFFAAGPIESAIMDRYRKLVPAGQEAVMVGYGSWETTLDALEQAVTARPWIAGERFTAADVYAGSQIDWPMKFGMLEPRPAFTAYIERLRSRPAYIRANSIDDALVAAEGAAAS